MKQITVGILGANGYTGYELVRLLLRHPNVKLSYLGSRSFKGKAYSEVYPSMQGLVDLRCDDKRLCEISSDLDCVFMATPQGFCMKELSEEVLSQTKVIDLSADFRLKDATVYEKWYKIKHEGVNFLSEAVYGLSEIHRANIKKARLVANAGCYTSCAILSLYPLVKADVLDLSSIIIDAKSGKSGAGRGEKLENLYCETNENFAAYGIGTHRHTPEIETQLSLAASKGLTVQFTPHLVPMQRGILSTIYARLSTKLSEDELRKIMSDFYKDEYFIKLLPKGILPQTRFVKGTNFTHINLHFDERTQRLIIISALDNLIKGAAGQAVQNLNILFGFDEKAGLELSASL
ncbi:N-acetyl-gamma-glutamyl-phosphate reductase [Campylobacter troglodytis]|uniref:N-acetyl-gamma-glutamyl-phosphate reductase n=1 Tax=Campylobacter troglodytis TaxID=654363 RepID=UPI001C8F13EE|nr:N-acetyl-gamma-glutamyl-phosphate reductase [Campylobacter troglodytis]